MKAFRKVENRNPWSPLENLEKKEKKTSWQGFPRVLIFKAFKVKISQQKKNQRISLHIF